ncbi:MAG: hypothetical protein ACJATI_002094 [Halioglobus sp.]|jgi:hypothetical protein
MKKHLYIFIVLLSPLFVISQNVDVEGGFIVESIDDYSEIIKNVADPISAQDNLIIYDIIQPEDVDVLDLGTADSDLDGAFRYGDFIELTNAGSSPGSSNQLSTKCGTLVMNNNGTGEDKVDDYVIYIQEATEAGNFYYVITESVQQRLDAGETPIAIYNSDNSLLDSLYGKTYQGGLIAYLNTITGSGLVAASVDQSTGAEWGCWGTFMQGTSYEIDAGQSNTTSIVDDCGESGIAAKLCDNLDYEGYQDWFLPSKDELYELYNNLKLNDFGGFDAGWYWTSTEDSATFAWSQDFLVGNQYANDKVDVNNNVRAVRVF